MSAVFDDANSFNGHVWPFRFVLMAFRQAGLRTNILARSKPRYWRGDWGGYAQAVGTTGQLVPAAKRLRKNAPPRGYTRPEEVWVDCAGLRSVTDPEQHPVGLFEVRVHLNVHMHKMVHQLGDHERVRGKLTFREWKERFWYLKTRSPARIIERMIRYLRDRRVAYVSLENVYQAGAA